MAIWGSKRRRGRGPSPSWIAPSRPCVLVDPRTGEPEMPRELAGVHQVSRRGRAVVVRVGLVVQELHDALGDALDRLGGDLGGGVTRPREPSTGRRRRRRVCPAGGWCDRERSHLGLHDLVFVVRDGRAFPAVMSDLSAGLAGSVKGGRQAQPQAARRAPLTGSDRSASSASDYVLGASDVRSTNLSFSISSFLLSFTRSAAECRGSRMAARRPAPASAHRRFDQDGRGVEREHGKRGEPEGQTRLHDESLLVFGVQNGRVPTSFSDEPPPNGTASAQVFSPGRGCLCCTRTRARHRSPYMGRGKWRPGLAPPVLAARGTWLGLRAQEAGVGSEIQAHARRRYTRVLSDPGQALLLGL